MPNSPKKHVLTRAEELQAKRDQSRDTRERLSALLEQRQYKEADAETLGKLLDISPQRVRVLAGKLGYGWVARWKKL